MLAIMSIKDEKGILRILMVDHGQCTFWDVSKGLRTPAQVTERIEWWKAQNIKSLGEQHPWLLDGYTDITNR